MLCVADVQTQLSLVPDGKHVLIAQPWGSVMSFGVWHVLIAENVQRTARAHGETSSVCESACS